MKTIIFKIIGVGVCISSVYGHPRMAPTFGNELKLKVKTFDNVSIPYVYELDSGFIIEQNVNEKGLVILEGQLIKPFMDDHVKLSVKYKDAQGNWIEGWCKMLYSYNQYNENLRASFELPASTQSFYDLKVELSSDANLDNSVFNTITWDKSVKHYKFGDYADTNCELDENEYTLLLTPKKDGTLIANANGKVTGIKDRVTPAYSWNKLSNIIMDNKKNDVVLSISTPAELVVETDNTKSVKIVNTGNISNVLASTLGFIYHEMHGHPIPYLYSYDDPVYMFAGKFSVNGFFIKFSQWPGEEDGPGYHNFKDPNNLESRYFNLYNKIQKKLSEIISDQEPVVIVSSIATGLRVYKNNGSYIDLTPYSTSNYGPPYFGYTNYIARRGPGSENLTISDTSEITLYGVGALRNNVTTSYNSVRSLQDIELEITKFINYVGIFGSNKLPVNNCSDEKCYMLKEGVIPDNNTTIVDWKKAPNSYIFIPNQENDGLYIPVKKAYAMWKNGIHMGGWAVPAGNITADVYWEDVPGLIRSGVNYQLEVVGTGEDAKIKVPVNKAKEGNAVITLRGSDNQIYWSWHVWVTDDPTHGTQFKSFDGVTRQKNDGTIESIPDADWGWMDRNLGALTGTITSDDWNKSGGLLYQWGRKDPQPPLAYKNDFYEVTGTVGRVRHQGFIDNTNSTTWQKINIFTKYIKLSNAKVGDNIRFSVNNPLGVIYINKDESNTQAYYKLAGGSDNLNAPVNWFGTSSTLPADRLSELNLWSDNAQGLTVVNYNDDVAAAPYRNKSSYDPCPNGWRIPSMLTANLGEDVRLDFSPFGIKENIKINELDFLPNSPNSTTGTYLYKIRPNDSNVPDYFKGFKVYSNIGVDMSNVGGHNMGVFPGTGAMLRGYHEG